MSSQVWVQTCKFCGKRAESENAIDLPFPYELVESSPYPDRYYNTHPFCSTECLAMWVGDKYLKRESG